MKFLKCLALQLVFILPISAQMLAENVERLISIETAKLKSADVETRRDAVLKLGSLQNAVASSVAARALGDSSAIVRATAAKAVVFLASEDAVKLLVRLLSDKSEFVRREAAFALGATFDKLATNDLIRILQTDKQPSVRAAAAIALGKIADERAIEPLSQILTAPQTKQNRPIDEFVRRSAARSLGEIRHRRAAPVLIAVLRDQSNTNDIRREAAAALGLIADASAIEVLRANLDSEDYYLAEIAANSLRLIQSAQNKR